MDTRCLYCGDPVPEGVHVCQACFDRLTSKPVENTERSSTMSKEDWIRKLCSRKFWLAIAGFVTGLLIYFGKTAEQADQVAALIMAAASVIAYILGEGLIDASREKSDTFIVDPEEKPPETMPL